MKLSQKIGIGFRIFLIMALCFYQIKWGYLFNGIPDYVIIIDEEVNFAGVRFIVANILSGIALILAIIAVFTDDWEKISEYIDKADK